MSKYLLYKPNKNCAEMPNGSQNIAVSLGDAFLAHPVYIYIYIQGVHKIILQKETLITF